jgi:hypothetical protein
MRVVPPGLPTQPLLLTSARTEAKLWSAAAAPAAGHEGAGDDGGPDAGPSDGCLARLPAAPAGTFDGVTRAVFDTAGDRVRAARRCVCVFPHATRAGLER